MRSRGGRDADDGSIDLQELFRQLAESVINTVMDADAEEMCSALGNSRNGYRLRTLSTCMGTLNLRIPGSKSFMA